MPGILRRDNCPLLILKYLSQDLTAYLAEDERGGGGSARLSVPGIDQLIELASAAVPEPSTEPVAHLDHPLPASSLGAAMARDRGSWRSLGQRLRAASVEESAPWTVQPASQRVPVSPQRSSRPLLETPTSPSTTSAAEGPARGLQVPASGDLSMLTHDHPPNGPDRALAAQALRVLAASAGLSIDSYPCSTDACSGTIEIGAPLAPVVFPMTAQPVSRRRLATISALLRVLHALTKNRPERISADLVAYK